MSVSVRVMGDRLTEQMACFPKARPFPRAVSGGDQAEDGHSSRVSGWESGRAGVHRADGEQRNKKEHIALSIIPIFPSLPLILQQMGERVDGGTGCRVHDCLQPSSPTPPVEPSERVSS